MTISAIYDTALYLAEKTDDNTGLIDQEYKNQHREKALRLIRQAIMRFYILEDRPAGDGPTLTMSDSVFLPDPVLHVAIPAYVGAILCLQDGESDKYNLLIYEYEQALNRMKYEEVQIEDHYFVLDGLEG